MASDKVVAVYCTEGPVRSATIVGILRCEIDVLAKHFGI